MVAISAGNQHSLVLERDVCVWGAGDNYFGQLGYQADRFDYYETTRLKFFVEVEPKWGILASFFLASTCEWVIERVCV